MVMRLFSLRIAAFLLMGLSGCLPASLGGWQVSDPPEFAQPSERPKRDIWYDVTPEASSPEQPSPDATQKPDQEKNASALTHPPQAPDASETSDELQAAPNEDSQEAEVPDLSEKLAVPSSSASKTSSPQPMAPSTRSIPQKPSMPSTSKSPRQKPRGRVQVSPPGSANTSEAVKSSRTARTPLQTPTPPKSEPPPSPSASPELPLDAPPE